jgi:hypothetical protein
MTLRWLVLLALVPAVAAEGQAYSSRAEAIRDPRLHAVRARYDSGFAKVVAAVDTANERLAPLRLLARFKNAHVGWAVQYGDTIVAMVPSPASAWLVVVPPDHPALSDLGSVLVPDKTATVPAVRVKPDLIAPTWAGVFLAYELSHVADAVMAVLPADPTESDFRKAQVRAYGLEYMATVAAGGPAYVRRLDSLIALVAPTSLHALASRTVSVLRGAYAGLDSLLGDIPPLSNIEEQRRAGVFAISMLFRFAEVNGRPDRELEAALHCLPACERRLRGAVVVPPRP